MTIPAIRAIGRDAEQKQLNELLAPDGPGLVLIEGHAGMGKSHLLDAVIATRDEVRALRHTADPLHHQWPFSSVLIPLVEGCSALMSARLADAQQELTETKAGLTFAAASSVRMHVVDLVIEALEELATEPVALVIDDAQWADGASIGALLAAAPRIATLPLTVVLARRPVDTGDGDELRRVCRADDTLVEIGELDPDSVDVLAAEVLGAPAGERLRRHLARAGGIPFHVLEVIEALRSEGAIVVSDGQADTSVIRLPATLSGMILGRVRRLAPDTYEMLRIAAVVGARVGIPELAELTGQTAVSLARPVREAIEAGVLVDERGLRFRHDLFREALYDDLPASVRAELHRQAARALSHAGASPIVVASHAALGAAPGDTQAAHWLREAAEQVKSATPVAALEMLDRALALAPDDPHCVAAIQEARVESLAGVGRLRDATAIAEHLVASAVRPEQQVHVRTRLASLLVLQNRPAEAVEQFDRALEECAGDAERADVLAQGALSRLAAGDVEGARRWCDEAMAVGERIGSRSAITLASSIRARLRAFGHDYSGALADTARSVALAQADPTGAAHLFVPWFFHGLNALDSDDTDLAQECLREGRAAADRAFTGWALPLYCGLAASLHLRQGNLEDAVAEAETGIGLAEESDSRLAQMWCEAIGAIAALHLGRTDDALELRRAALASFESGHAMLGFDFVWLADALVSEGEGDLPAARAALRDAWDLVTAMGIAACQPVLAAALVRVEDDDAARREVADEMRAVARRCGVPRYELLSRHCTGVAARDESVLRDTAAAYEAAGRPIDAASVWNDLATIVKPIDAVECRTAAAALLASCGVPADVTAPILEQPSADDSWSTLTPTEEAVVQLLAEGYTNAEIAERRVVSRRTVESHLSRIYAKLGFGTRVQLVAEASRRYG